MTTDGEKSTRDRDSEFEIANESRESLIEFWDRGWRVLFENIEPLTIDDFSKEVAIRGQEHTIVEAINRQLTHYSYHIGQIVLLAKHFRSSEWKTLSIAKSRSVEFNEFLAKKRSAGEPLGNRMDTPAEFAERDKK